MSPTVVLGRCGCAWEDALLAQADDSAGGGSVVACRSLVDLLVAAETTSAHLVVVDEKFPRLVDGLTRLRSLARVVVVGSSAMADVSAARIRLEDLLAAGGAGPSPGRAGRVIAVWGPPGSWGVTQMAMGLADSLSREGGTLLIDANVHSPSVAFEMELPPGGLLQACLSADRGALQLPIERRSGPDVLTGVEPGLYPAVHAGALQEVVRAACRDYDYVVLDLDSALDAGAEIGIVPDWTTASAVGLREADQVVIVAGETALARQRLWQHLPAVARHISRPAIVVINRCTDPRRVTADLAARLGDFLPEAAVGWISGPVTERSLAPIVAEVCG